MKMKTKEGCFYCIEFVHDFLCNFSTFVGDTLAEAYRKPIEVDTLIWLNKQSEGVRFC